MGFGIFEVITVSLPDTTPRIGLASRCTVQMHSANAIYFIVARRLQPRDRLATGAGSSNQQPVDVIHDAQALRVLTPRPSRQPSQLGVARRLAPLARVQLDIGHIRYTA